jgi:uncharacterized membrane-anchored protein YitT (DUF2179 family)
MVRMISHEAINVTIFKIVPIFACAYFYQISWWGKFISYGISLLLMANVDPLLCFGGKGIDLPKHFILAVDSKNLIVLRKAAASIEVSKFQETDIQHCRDRIFVGRLFVTESMLVLALFISLVLGAGFVVSVTCGWSIDFSEMIAFIFAKKVFDSVGPGVYVENGEVYCSSFSMSAVEFKIVNGNIIICGKIIIPRRVIVINFSKPRFEETRGE